MPKFKGTIEKALIAAIVDKEFKTASVNRQVDDDEFNSYIDLLDSVREAKQYDWMSDIRIPEFVSHVLTQASIDANQYFSTKDFVEVYLEDDSDEAIAASESAKECINRTLNKKHLYHYLKYMRAKSLNNITGRVYARCWWEQKTRRELVGVKERFEPTGFDIEGFDLEEGGEPGFERIEEPVFEEVPVLDRFNYDVIDSRNVFTDNKYTYSIQQKDWVILRSEKTIEDLYIDREDNGYFNLDLVGKVLPTNETETSRNTYNDNRSATRQTKEDSPVNKYYDILERFGKYWCIVTNTDEAGEPTGVRPGIDEFGKPQEDAVLLDAIITFAVSGNSRTLIRFQLTPYIDYNGQPYKPLIRGICYIHPTYDAGMGDGKHVRELQLALDDTFNIGNDRVMLATLPTLMVKRYESEDNPDIYIEPGHKIPLENPKDDLGVLEIGDDINGSLNQMAMLRGMMQQVDAIFPTTMGDTPGIASTTATAIAGAEQRTDIRSNYKALTFENTFLTELYWMILNMTWTFAHPSTGEKLMGDKVVDFNPDKDYYYKPLSQSIEPEYSKANKIKLWTQILGYATTISHPDTVKLVNFILTQILKLMGDEFANYANNLLNPETPIQEPSNVQTQGARFPTSNQTGIPQGTLEQEVRE